MYIVTGATGGIGKELVRGLLKMHKAVVMGCRNAKKMEVLLGELQSEFPHENVEGWELDLASAQSIKTFADRVRQSGRKVEGLLNNAGIMPAEYGLTREGYELNIGVNYLGTVALTEALADVAAASEGLVVNTVSVTSWIGRGDERIFTRGGKGYRRLVRYSDSKAALASYTRVLNERMKDQNVRICAVDPGVVDTGMLGMGKWFDALTDLLFRPFTRSAKRAACITLRLVKKKETGIRAHGYFSRKLKMPSEKDKALWEATKLELAKHF